MAWSRFVPQKLGLVFSLHFPFSICLCGIAAAVFLTMTVVNPSTATEEDQKTRKGDRIMALSISSQAFSQNGSIPARYTCDGQDTSPPLAWSGLPQGAKSLVLIVDDPDAPDPKAPKMTWVHWVLYNIPLGSTALMEGVKAGDLPDGTKEGLNDWKRTGYGGPCPPIGRHRYFHKLYALDIVLPDLGKPTKAQLENAMQGHIVEQCELVGTYQRSR
jgi:Raf kinase inhibitor-like YbhB/YbcL family protein